MTSENTLFAIESQMYRIVCLKILLLLLPLLTLSKIDLTNSGPHRNLNTTSKNNWNRKQKFSFIVKIFKVFVTQIYSINLLFMMWAVGFGFAHIALP